VVAVCIWQWYGGTYKDGRDQRNFFARLAVDPQTIFKVHPDFIMTPEAKAAFQKERTACIADAALAQRLGWKIGDVIPLTGDIFPGNIQLKLVGTYTSDDPQEALLLSWKYISEGLPPARQGNIGSYLVLVDTPQHVSRVSRHIDALFANSPAPTRTETEHDFAVSFLAFLGNLKLFLGAVAGAVAFTILLVCGNTVAMAVRERTRETAILRTLGFTPDQIAGFILGEAAVLGLIGGALGTLLAAGICAAIHNAPSAGFPMPLLTPAMALIVIFAALVIGVVSALIPAYFAARRSVLESLRFSG
jgi:putative ABC transport system permease protein